jgi:adenine-specific DNA-methyltransferase
MRNVFKYLSQCSTHPNEVDRLIISAFLNINNISVKKNEFLKSYIISNDNSSEFSKLQKFITIINSEIPQFKYEELIELFEFVISPADRIVNGAIYTPLKIRNYIVDSTFQKKREFLSTLKVADISCGCGGFLFSSAKYIKERSNRSYAEIFKNQIFGLDIQSYSVTRTKLLLSVLALSEGEDKNEFHFNLFEGDALCFNWDNKINRFHGFDIVVGNPPYVCARNLNEDIKEQLKKWDVCKSGNTDLYIPFFQIGIESLNTSGILGYITMNSFFKSLNGRALRSYFQNKSLDFKIIDFGTYQIFKSKNTYTCICFIENTSKDCIKYYRCKNGLIPKLERDFNKILYNSLDSIKGWNLHDNEIISKIESTGVALGDLYKTRHGIATLKNEIFIFNPVKEDKDYYYLQNGSLFPIEKGICKDIINSNKLSRETSIKNLKEKVIFPYENIEKAKLIDEKTLRSKFPKAYNYLQQKKTYLADRDKGKGDYENWYAFGRTQSLEKVKNKLFFPKISDRTPSYIINSDENLLFYNGQAIIGHSKEEMILIKKVMESRLFWYYIESTSKPYMSNYFSLNGNYIRNFGIFNFSESDKKYLISEENKDKIDAFIEKLYGVKIPIKKKI